jgi:hypothetical protein
MKLSIAINIFHTGLSLYLAFGWMLPLINNKILIGFVPCVYFNWLVDDHRCILTRIEHHYIELEAKKEERKIHIPTEGFVQSKLKSYNILLTRDSVNKLLIGVMFHTFLQSYYNVIIL